MSNEKDVNWKDTLNLPKTEFPMKARLNKKEPELLKFWNDIKIYERIIEKNKNSETFMLHDGPPYANGHIHLGHALNKILKDFIVKTKSMEGFKAPYKPGWDCHGLPIEIKVDKDLGKRKRDMEVPEIREKCREYAENFINIQRDEFKRLGIFGDWDNPYTTINPVYESYILKAFKSFVESGNIIRKKRPVYWCTSCHTALAEAEVEYDNHTSPSIYVKFKLADYPDFLSEFQDKEISVLIWTTTPWTIPANLAIAVKEDYDYALFELNGEYYIAAELLIPLISELVNSEYKILKKFKGNELKGVNTVHPLIDRNSIIITTNYVTLDQGTGCVHTAPGHGEDDYRAGLEYGLDIYAPVGPTGLFDETVEKYSGQKIFASNNIIVEDLDKAGRLLYSDSVEHSYPHCWRCKKPIIFRATEQWFISMDTAELRNKALEEIKKVKWIPEWGEGRISNMVGNRPDWCISRQRNWGVPLPVFFCEKCDHPVVEPDIIDKVRSVFEKEGSDSWYKKDINYFLPDNYKCEKCGSSEFRKGVDILDVWFESGSSFGVLENSPEHKFPADLYLEGGDQYRGWFHSSLLVGVSYKKRSPYESVLTHGWVLDHKGRAMSKSIGNVISPQTIIDDKGAEILRLWVAMVNYREDIKLGNEVISRVVESYRKIRNTWKFMLGVMSDFSPDNDSVSVEDYSEIETYILYKLQILKKKILEAYKMFEFHTIFHAISNFFITDLSSFYLHITKDNLYCNLKNSKERKATQTVIFKLLKETTLLLAPILSFTTEEVWEHIPDFKGKTESVHLCKFPEIDKEFDNLESKEIWSVLMNIRDLVQKEIEAARSEKIIGDSLEAEITLTLPEKDFKVISNNKSIFKNITVTSKVNIKSGKVIDISVKKFEGSKCPRCWNWFENSLNSTDNTDLCPRCNSVIKEI